MSAILELTQGRSPPRSPFALFDEWLGEATTQEVSDPNAMALATIERDGRISQRMVLLKGRDDGGFYFYTNFNSRKAQALLQNPQAALLFHWKSMRRQVRIEGKVSTVSEAQADAYFATRPRGRQLGAWASKQSEPLASRAVLEQRVQDVTAQYSRGDGDSRDGGDGEDLPVPRPPHWSGFLLRPDYMEFWHDGDNRLHDRFAFQLQADGAPVNADAWQISRLYP
ncbi:MAG: pyridoxamine 5'-phosphate oxidase [Alphaproteobacteria bacterium]|nr:pyridoxamine 5'-phosphate oxidase [Alphaproteobacteria bacterium]